MATAETHLRTAKYDGSCLVCRGSIQAGASIWWTQGVKGAVHEACYTPPAVEETTSLVAVEGEDTTTVAYLLRYLAAEPALACAGCKIGCRGCDTRPNLPW